MRTPDVTKVRMGQLWRVRTRHSVWREMLWLVTSQGHPSADDVRFAIMWLKPWGPDNGDEWWVPRVPIDLGHEYELVSDVTA